MKQSTSAASAFKESSDRAFSRSRPFLLEPYTAGEKSIFLLPQGGYSADHDMAHFKATAAAVVEAHQEIADFVLRTTQGTILFDAALIARSQSYMAVYTSQLATVATHYKGMALADAICTEALGAVAALNKSCAVALATLAAPDPSALPPSQCPTGHQDSQQPTGTTMPIFATKTTTSAQKAYNTHSGNARDFMSPTMGTQGIYAHFEGGYSSKQDIFEETFKKAVNTVVLAHAELNIFILKSVHDAIPYDRGLVSAAMEQMKGFRTELAKVGAFYHAVAPASAMAQAANATMLAEADVSHKNVDKINKALDIQSDQEAASQQPVPGV